MARQPRHHATTKVAGLALVLLFAASTLPALESNGYSIEVLVGGRPLTEYAARNTSYIEARRTAEYSIRVQNHTNRRIAVALSVDGLNTINALTTTAAKASKWVLNPYQTITVDGWQTGSDTARKFFFATEDSSYGAWLDNTTNLGIIEAVVFREKRKLIALRERRSERGCDKASPSSQSAVEGESALSDEIAATGIGDQIDNRVVRVQMKTESRPVADLRLRYEYREQLVELGVLHDRRHLNRRERARGFADYEYSPDPYKGR
ncbi:MAG: hypothetical protein GY906_13590 [bacterium]|nr:hypothetical protein [bacterium]